MKFMDEIRFPEGEPTAFQELAMQRIATALRPCGVQVREFKLDVGAKRAFWTSFEFKEQEHIVTIYPDELNLIVDTRLYENYLRHEFESEEVLVDSFVRRLTRLLREGIWSLPEEDRGSWIARAIDALFRRRER